MNRKSLNEFVNKYPKLYEGLKVVDNSKIKRLTIIWKPLYLLRLSVTYAVLLSLKNYPGFQVICLLVISVIQQVCIIKTLPYEGKGRNGMNIFNELAVSASLYTLLCLISQEPTDDQDLSE
jgi:hypothetical protein